MSFLLLSCQGPSAINVTQSEFERLYLKPRYELHHIDYDGPRQGYQYLTERSIGRVGSYPTIQQVYRTPDGPAIRSFVRRPQSAVEHDPALDIRLSPDIHP